MEKIYFDIETPISKALTKFVGDKLSYIDACNENVQVSIKIDRTTCTVEFQGNVYSLVPTLNKLKVHPNFKDL